ncbi:E3 ubiquitin-protein ligase Midline-1-like [Athene cunicularia]|uniref:E3 ubiquitin-protein ligase Midline-1-like n=1 Tax=Athene cunicularia TaxID=194338 RepID=UPI000EF737F2|nr:E3 ubiquitin-protein ligase Midline-1-like [Athene cunicularia]
MSADSCCLQYTVDHTRQCPNRPFGDQGNSSKSSLAFDIHKDPSLLPQLCFAHQEQAAACAEGPFSCPLCQARADPAALLQPNVQLRSIAQRFLDAPARQEEKEPEVQREEKGEGSGQEDGVVLCDFCLQDPQPAAKTCLSCEASLCQAHLTRHNTKSPSKDHVLMEPCDAQVLAKRRCPQHGKLLECYCETDSACICMLCCVMTSHKNHKIITLEEAFSRAQSVFHETLNKVESHEAELKQSIENLLKQEEGLQIMEHMQKSQLESLYKEVHLQINNKKEEVLKALRQRKEEQLSQIRSEIQKYKEMKDTVSCDIKELKVLRDEKDHLLFVKAFAAIQAREREPVPDADSVKLPMLPVIVDESITNNTLRFLEDFFSRVKFLLKTLPVHEHLTFTVRSKNEILCSCKKVTPSSVSSSRAKGLPHVLSDQKFSEGCHFWEVDTSNATSWKLGIIHQTFEQYLERSHDYLRVVDSFIPIKEEKFTTALKVIRLYLDCGRDTLSFYDVSVKDGDPDVSVRFIESLSSDGSYPVRATFGVYDGSLKLL